MCIRDSILEKRWQRLVLTHLKEKVHKGVLTGSAITDMKITLISGKAHNKHTKGGDFRAVSYTHLDVYKRQVLYLDGSAMTFSRTLSVLRGFSTDISAASLMLTVFDHQCLK